jgi:hypothetical protein
MNRQMVNRLITKSIKVNIPSTALCSVPKRGLWMTKHMRPTRGFWDWWHGGGKDDTGSNG